MEAQQYQLLPSLSESEYAALKADIAARGVMVPIEKDEHGNTLDGFHRERICRELGIGEYPVIIRAGMSDHDKFYHGLALNLERRHLSAEQRRELVSTLRSRFAWSNVVISELLGVDEITVRRDLESGSTNVEPERVEGKDGKSYPARRPKSVFAKSLAQADGAMKCLELTGWTEGERDTVTAGEVLREGNRTLAAISTNGHNGHNPLMTSDSHEWYTPAPLVERVRRVLGAIDLDPCTSLKANETVRAPEFYTADDDGLKQQWAGRVFMNPPYGSVISEWVEKLVVEFEAGRTSHAIALVPARTDTAWFRLLRPYPRCFLTGRLQFSGPGDVGNSATFPSVVVTLGCDLQAFHAAFSEIGDVYEYFNGGAG